MAMSSSAPAEHWVSVTPHNSTNLAPGCRGLWVGTGGNLVAVSDGDAVVTFTNIADGTLIPLAVKRVNSTNTTASGIVALY